MTGLEQALAREGHELDRLDRIGATAGLDDTETAEVVDAWMERWRNTGSTPAWSEVEAAVVRRASGLTWQP